LWLFVAALSVVVFTGCIDGPQRYTVTGNATFEGEPIPLGDLVFADISGQEASEGGRIIDGEFSVELTAGEKRVEIEASKDVPGETPPLRESYIPEKYNVASELSVTVRASGDNTFTFELKK